MEELVQVLWGVLGGTAVAPYLGLVALVAFILVHVVAVLPVSVTSKIPDVVMVILNKVAGNYKSAVNAKTDSKGNPK